MRRDRADVCHICNKDAPSLDAHIAAHNYVATRTRAMLDYRPGVPAFVVLDFDVKGMPDTARRRLDELGGFVAALETIMPEIEIAAYIRRSSTSSIFLRRHV